MTTNPKMTNPNEKGDFTGSQAIVAILQLPLGIYVSVVTFLALYGWFLEPIVHVHLTWWHMFGLGCIYAYYAKFDVSDDSTKAIKKHGGWGFILRPYVKYGFLLGTGWLAHWMMIRP